MLLSFACWAWSTCWLQPSCLNHVRCIYPDCSSFVVLQTRFYANSVLLTAGCLHICKDKEPLIAIDNSGCILPQPLVPCQLLCWQVCHQNNGFAANATVALAIMYHQRTKGSSTALGCSCLTVLQATLALTNPMLCHVLHAVIKAQLTLSCA